MPQPVPDISVVVPLYNEEATLEELFYLIRDVCVEEGLSFEVWFVDDGSTDGSWDVIQRLHEEDPRAAGVRFLRNYGKSAALAVGFERVRAPVVVTIDADLQDDPREIPGLVGQLEEGYDLVSGWKKNRKDPLQKTISSRFFNFFTRMVSGIPLHDFNCGLKVYRREVVQNVQIYGELHRYIPLLAKWEGYDRISERPVKHHPRRHGDTKFGLERYLRGFLDLISVSFLVRFAARPMHFFGTFGGLFFVVGVVISAYLTVMKFMGRPLQDRPLLFLGMLLIMVGVQLFSTGLLGEMIIRPKMEDTSGYQIARTFEPALPGDPAVLTEQENET
jgi:glycosyltransferase involved in cell wall biosynthesis